MCYNGTNFMVGIHRTNLLKRGIHMYPDDSLTLHTDLYQINMMQVYFDQGIHNKHAVFEVYFLLKTATQYLLA